MAAKGRKLAKKGARRDKNAAKRALSAKSGAAPAEKGDELIDMNEAIDLLKTTRPTFYRWLRSGKIKGMKVGRQWRFTRGDIERFLKGQAPRVDLPADIGPLIGTLQKELAELGGKDRTPEDYADVRHAVTLMIQLGDAMKASDIHLSPHLPEGARRAVASLRYRVDGVLHQKAEIDIRLLPAIVERWKYMAACDVTEKVLSQDGRILIELDGGKDLDLRVNFLPASLGEMVTVRILDRSAVSLDLSRIDYAPGDREKLLEAVRSPWGLICVTGPTGSGKTTVLYSCLTEVAGPHVKTMSIEDPVELQLPWATQVPVRESAGMTFDRAVRAILRSDPDVILIGEIRNFETLMVAHQAALTGHLILTTLHANEAALALKRMVDIGSPPFVVADSTRLVLSQRLARRLCRECASDAEPEAARIEQVRELAAAGGLDWNALTPTWKKPVGCPKCGKTGYRGRTVIAEVLEVTPEIGRALREGASVDELRRIAVSQGMTTMAADGVRRAAKGDTTLDEVMRVLG